MKDDPIRHATQSQRDIMSALLDISRLEHQKPDTLSPFFLRRPYSGTSAETQDDTQERLHEFDYLR